MIGIPGEDHIPSCSLSEGGLCYDQSTSEDVENFLRLPALAVIPSLGGQTRRRLLSALPGAAKRNGTAKNCC